MAISNAVEPSAIARTLGIKTSFIDLRAGNVQLLPQRVAVIGQGSTVSVYATTKRQVTSAKEGGELYGFGSPIHLELKQLFPENGDGVGTIPVTVYPLEDDGSGVASVGDITPSGAAGAVAAYQVVINNIASESFTLAIGDAVAAIVAKMVTAINAVLDMPVIATDNATDVILTSKWKGSSANGIVASVIGSSTDVTYVITQPVGGLVNPDVTTALDQVGDIWESMILSSFEVDDTTTLDLFSDFGEGRWGALTRKPLVVFSGETVAGVTAATAVPDARPNDRTNAQLVAPGSKDLPFVVAARQLARIVVRANENPPFDYGSLDASGLTPGTDGEQWTYAERDLAIKAGSSSIQVKDGVINVSDTITFYKPVGEVIPAYRYVVDIVKLQNIIYNLGLIFDTPEWDGAPLIPDNQPNANRAAKKPRAAKAAIASLIDSLGLNAIISDPDAAKAQTLVEINDQNPKRLDIRMTVQLSGNTNIISVNLDFGFFFGTPSIVS